MDILLRPGNSTANYILQKDQRDLLLKAERKSVKMLIREGLALLRSSIMAVLHKPGVTGRDTARNPGSLITKRMIESKVNQDQ